MLTIEGEEASGEVAVEIPPGTKAKQIEKLLLAALTDAIYRAAEDLSVVVAASPIRYARQLPGRDEAGRTVYAVRARREGGKLVPAHKAVGPPPR